MLLRPLAVAVLTAWFGVSPISAQSAGGDFDSQVAAALAWREIGPYRGGRVAAVCGVIGDRNTYWMGSTGGGVWRTDDQGQSWRNLSDGHFGGSIGAIAVAPSDSSVIWVGGGEKTLRGNMSSGDGVWRSIDAGRNWQHLGLEGSRHISRIRVHPRNPDVAYLAVMGSAYGPSAERGVFRTTDGGKTFERVLFVNAECGCVDLSLDPTNPRILFAAFWRVRRTPYSLESGGQGSGLWKSEDGGESWVSLGAREGMPEGPIGICGISVCPSDPDSVYAAIEAKDGGIFRSRDGGETWKRVNQERKLRQRAWYYTRIYADPNEKETVYVLNVELWRSRDGGKSFEEIAAPHSDHHDLWIDPLDSARMIESNDGGANISHDSGRTWSTQANQPTAQMYRVAKDDAFPYRLLGGQQDNTAVRIRTRSLTRGEIGEADFEPTAGGESGHIAALPGRPDRVFGGSYGGFMTMLDHETRARRAVHVWPDDPIGHGAAELRYRFNWNYPLHASRFRPRLYCAANVLFASDDEGASWQELSQDLTRNDKSKQGPSGGPITKDNTSVEYYGTIFAFAEGAKNPEILWTGSDDGLIHLSRDGGKSWSNVTPAALPEWSQINSLEAHPERDGGVYVAANRYKLDDFSPSLWRTLDFGQTWTRIDAGLPRGEFTRVLRADANRNEVLYCGTERGVYVSRNDGQSWRPFRLGLPIVPVTDLLVHKNELVAATQGRGYWIFDDLKAWHELQAPEARSFGLLEFEETLRIVVPRSDARGRAGTNPHPGLQVLYWLDRDLQKGDELTLEIFDENDERVRRYIHEGGKGASEHRGEGKIDRLPKKAGLNRFSWNLRVAGPESFEGQILWNGGRTAPMIPPGRYQAKLSLREGDALRVSEASFVLRPDPRSETTSQELVEQYRFLLEVRGDLSRVHRCLRGLRDLKEQIGDIEKRVGQEALEGDLMDALEAAKKALSEIEEALYQTKNQAAQDPLNFPVRLNDKLAGVLQLAAVGDYPPTQGMRAVHRQLKDEAEAVLSRYDAWLSEGLSTLNLALQNRGFPTLYHRPD